MTAAPTKPAAVYQAICRVMEALSKEGISKDRRTEGGGPKYSFRGIDDVYNALAPMLATNGLIIIPRCLTRECIERKSNNGGALFYVTVEAEFTLVSSEDGSSVVARTFGEALDSSDKATNKAMSAAYKYMAMQTFCIPTQGDNDTENANHEVRPPEPPQARPEAKRADPAPPTLAARADRLAATLKGVKTQADLRKAYDLGAKLCAELDDKDPERLTEINALYETRFADLAEKVAA